MGYVKIMDLDGKTLYDSRGPVECRTRVIHDVNKKGDGSGELEYTWYHVDSTYEDSEFDADGKIMLGVLNGTTSQVSDKSVSRADDRGCSEASDNNQDAPGRPHTCDL